MIYCHGFLTKVPTSLLDYFGDESDDNDEQVDDRDEYLDGNEEDRNNNNDDDDVASLMYCHGFLTNAPTCACYCNCHPACTYCHPNNF